MIFLLNTNHCCTDKQLLLNDVTTQLKKKIINEISDIVER